MKKTGIIVGYTGKNEVFAVLLDAESQQKMKSQNYTEKFFFKNGSDSSEIKHLASNAKTCGINSCDSCSGCANREKPKGLFVLTGRNILAVNKTGTCLNAGDTVSIHIHEEKIFLQIFFSIIIPFTVSTLFYFACLKFFNCEILSIVGSFAGFAVGIAVPIIVQKFLGTKSLPEITSICLLN